MFFMAGLVVAAEFTIVKYDKDKKELVATDDKGKEVTLKVTDKTKINVIDKDGNKTEGKVEDLERRWTGEKAVGRKVDLEVSGSNITTVNLRQRGKKQ
jgi:hypothetical protein